MNGADVERKLRWEDSFDDLDVFEEITEEVEEGGSKSFFLR